MILKIAGPFKQILLQYIGYMVDLFLKFLSLFSVRPFTFCFKLKVLHNRIRGRYKVDYKSSSFCLQICFTPKHYRLMPMYQVG